MREPQEILEELETLLKKINETFEDYRQKRMDAISAQESYDMTYSNKYLRIKFGEKPKDMPLKTVDDYKNYLQADEELFNLRVDMEVKAELADIAKRRLGILNTAIDVLRSELSYLKVDIA